MFLVGPKTFSLHRISAEVRVQLKLTSTVPVRVCPKLSAKWWDFGRQLDYTETDVRTWGWDPPKSGTKTRSLVNNKNIAVTWRFDGTEILSKLRDFETPFGVDKPQSGDNSKTESKSVGFEQSKRMPKTWQLRAPGTAPSTYPQIRELSWTKNLRHLIRLARHEFWSDLDLQFPGALWGEF